MQTNSTSNKNVGGYKNYIYNLIFIYSILNMRRMLVKKSACLQDFATKFFNIFIKIHLMTWRTHSVTKNYFHNSASLCTFWKKSFLDLIILPWRPCLWQLQHSRKKILNTCAIPFPNMSYLPLSFVSLLDRDDILKFKFKIFRLTLILRT